MKISCAVTIPASLHSAIIEKGPGVLSRSIDQLVASINPNEYCFTPPSKSKEAVNTCVTLGVTTAKTIDLLCGKAGVSVGKVMRSLIEHHCDALCEIADSVAEEALHSPAIQKDQPIPGHYVYVGLVMAANGDKMLKFGITSDLSARLYAHRLGMSKLGGRFIPIQVFEFAERSSTLACEIELKMKYRTAPKSEIPYKTEIAELSRLPEILTEINTMRFKIEPMEVQAVDHMH